MIFPLKVHTTGS